MTVLEAIEKSRVFLHSKGLESARLESEWLLGHVLNLPRLQLYLNFERILNEAETARLRELVKRRASREPLQHLLGTAQFCGLEIEVDRNVLIPRPETELLAEAAWRLLNEVQRPTSFLDFGTGTGCIAISICRHAAHTRGVALDKSPAALEVAARNAARHSLQDRVAFVQSDGFAAVPQEAFDLIVSNPPYIPSSEIPRLQPEVRDYDPRTALDGGADGLEFYRLLAAEATRFVAPAGRMLLEFGDGQADAVSDILRQQNWPMMEVREDLSGRGRFLFAARAG